MFIWVKLTAVRYFSWYSSFATQVNRVKIYIFLNPCIRISYSCSSLTQFFFCENCLRNVVRKIQNVNRFQLFLPKIQLHCINVRNYIIMDLHCTVVNPALNLSITYKCKKLHYIEYLPKTLIILVSRGVKIYIIHLVH